MENTMEKNGQSQMKTMIFKYVSYAVILLALCTMGYCMYLIYPRVVLQPNVQPYAIETKKLKVKDKLLYIADVCKKYELRGEVIRVLVAEDETNYVLDSITTNIQKGCNKNPVSIPIPDFLTAGKYYLKIKLTYRVNALQTQNYEFKTETFEIIK